MTEAFTYLIFIVVFSGIFCLYNSLVIREIAALILKFNDHSFHSSLIMSFYLTLFFILRFFFGKVLYLNVLWLIAFIPLFILLTKREYVVSTKQATYMFLWWFLFFMVLMFICILILGYMRIMIDSAI